MAALIRNLAVSGSRKTDGTANASGKVFLYSPGTTIIVPGYKDDDLSEAWTTSNGGIPLDAGGKVKIWVNDMVDVVVQDADGTTVDTMIGFNKTRAEQVEIENENYLGALTDSSGAVTQDMGGRTNLDDVLTRAADSLGPDFKYQESAGATARPYIEVIGDIAVSVKDFHAAGNNVADDAIPIQQAVNRVKARGGGVVYFPPGTYKASSAISLASATGVNFRGAGFGSTTLVSSTGANVLTLTSCSTFDISGLNTGAVADSTNSAILMTSCSDVSLNQYASGALASPTGKFRYPLNLSSCSRIVLNHCSLNGVAADASARALLCDNSERITAIATMFNAVAGYSIEFTLAASDFLGLQCTYLSAPRFALGLTGSRFVFVGGNLSSALSIATATYRDIRLFGGANYGTTTDLTSGSTFTPDLATGDEFRIRGTTTGSAYVIAAPTPPPMSTMRDKELVLHFYNNAGGAVTGWTMTPYHLTGAISTANGDHTMLTLRWDVDQSVWRETARAVTT